VLSQLGLIILDASAATCDEMSAAPHPDGSYGPIDGLLDEIAIGVVADPLGRGYRRPEDGSAAD
jgi:hypothetical protein